MTLPESGGCVTKLFFAKLAGEGKAKVPISIYFYFDFYALKEGDLPIHICSAAYI